MSRRFEHVLVLVVALSVGYAGAAAADSTSIHPIVLSNGILLGGVDSSYGGWMSAEDVAPVLRGGERYRFLDLRGYREEATGAAPESYGQPCPHIQYIDLFPEPFGHIGVGGDWDPLPRAPASESTSQRVYREAAADILRANGLADPKVILKRVIRVDLDGDGIDEVVMSASSYEDRPSPDARRGDYSLVFLRRLHRGNVETTLLAGEIHTRDTPRAAPNVYDVAAILDLNGDGTMEIAVEHEYYEGGGMTILQIRATGATQVLAGGCGA